MGAIWIQRKVTVSGRPRGFHLVTREIVEAIPELAHCRTGLLHLFVQHTSCSLTINENADPDVRRDLESVLSATAPEDFPYRHDTEGPDDMPAHYKTSLMGVSLTVPVGQGRLLLGTWQGITFAEHRDEPSTRYIIITLFGEGP